MKHYLCSHNLDEDIFTFEKFDYDSIKKTIIDYLLKNPNDTLEHHNGFATINFYVNKNNKICQLILKGRRGEREYYRPIQDLGQGIMDEFT